MAGCREIIIWDDLLLGEGQAGYCGDEVMGQIILCNDCLFNLNNTQESKL